MGTQLHSFPCLHRIQTMYSEFSAKERKIADYILENPQRLVHSTINQVADQLLVADATVFRFCKRIGFSGFQALKIALAAEAARPGKNMDEAVKDTDNEKAVAIKVFESNIQTLQDTIHTLNQKHLHEAVEWICRAKHIVFYGCGSASVIALDALEKFLQTDLAVTAYTDPHLQLLSAARCTKEDVAVFISHAGADKEMLKLLQAVQKTGAKTIAITQFAKSPLSQKADVPLFTVSQEADFRFSSFSARIVQLSLIDTLYVNVMLRYKDTNEEILQKGKETYTV
ncbi:MurR/RpiR family transcriptional regulator [Heyndrickxia coagulans]|uniref:Transcriptional regulator, RpiR family n=1 Tax=Heyndrickxia coagulans DSM 1 = ATCC 7050 TaxID=1121088 RepID=A0A8B4BV22_HEYCO|nr:MurR/RpiR family transcriptional regulator [Heyndrickxia coagulans]AJH80142.1 SIS domain protein [Heyndrickxia coagulans DSM 1 = ATCC 7050]MCR2846601.1 MurR/RpiR family transcriptional regulator [Heyndrickxia coagulans]MDR4224318.1 MurR/RpiR family transcriptional regulator [Heyndrickxia coagulans DSM 1 = ATCC 7050]MED4493913.1 MurR/RpiR family transcriptional regulator [Heyndrickxia coagulans]MED4537249.1 MurR/RpiR family transcriptional regulator [Heyndrickxia coagulans]